MMLAKVTLWNVKFFDCIIFCRCWIIKNRIINMTMMSIRFRFWFTGFQQQGFSLLFITILKSPFLCCEFPFVNYFSCWVFVCPPISINITMFWVSLKFLSFVSIETNLLCTSTIQVLECAKTSLDRAVGCAHDATTHRHYHVGHCQCSLNKLNSFPGLCPLQTSTPCQNHEPTRETYHRKRFKRIVVIIIQSRSLEIDCLDQSGFGVFG